MLGDKFQWWEKDFILHKPKILQSIEEDRRRGKSDKFIRDRIRKNIQFNSEYLIEKASRPKKGGTRKLFKTRKQHRTRKYRGTRKQQTRKAKK